MREEQQIQAKFDDINHRLLMKSMFDSDAERMEFLLQQLEQRDKTIVELQHDNEERQSLLDKIESLQGSLCEWIRDFQELNKPGITVNVNFAGQSIFKDIVDHLRKQKVVAL